MRAIRDKVLFKETAGAPVQVFKKTLKVINTVKKRKSAARRIHYKNYFQS